MFFISDLSSDKIVSGEQEHSLISNLHSILKPFLLRRIKTEVAKDLPRKIEMIVYCPLVDAQKKLYSSAIKGPAGLRNDIITNGVEQEVVVLSKRKRTRYCEVSDDEYFNTAVATDIKEDNFAGVVRTKIILSAMGIKAKGVGQLKLQNICMQLRKVCNHPLLFDIPTESLELLEDDDQALGHFEALPEYLSTKKNVKISSLPELVYTSGKMLMLERLLPELLSNGHKVLIFSQMTKQLDIISDYMDMKNWPFCRIDGNIKMADRQEQIKVFQEGDVKIFLLSTRSGGLGINLTASDTVIIYDR